MSAQLQTRPFQIAVDDHTLQWITDRVKTAHIAPDITHPPGEEWADGTPSSDMEELKKYWSDDYDWRRVETKLNETYKMFMADIEEGDETISLHFVHHRSERKDAIPLIFAHGWPGNFTEVEKLLALTNPSDPEQQAFHVVAPSLPGFVFSSAAKKPGFGIARIARVYHQLMLGLGYTTFVGQAGDWGSFVLRSLAIQFPSSFAGLHINFPIALPPSPLKHPLALFYLAIGWLTPSEKKQLERMQWFMTHGNGYSRIQGTKPQTLSHALLDSPIGMLSWIREKMVGAVELDYVWDKEEVITWTMFYLLSNSAGHARLYKAAAETVKDEVLTSIIPWEVPVGISVFPRDVGFLTKWWAEASLAENVTTFKVHEKGGHFPSVEVPESLIADVLEFVETIPEERKKLLFGQ